MAHDRLFDIHGQPAGTNRINVLQMSHILRSGSTVYLGIAGAERFQETYDTEGEAISAFDVWSDRIESAK